jgi:NRPS condensation-like uncharacterized protein
VLFSFELNRAQLNILSSKWPLL